MATPPRPDAPRRRFGAVVTVGVIAVIATAAIIFGAQAVLHHGKATDASAASHTTAKPTPVKPSDSPSQKPPAVVSNSFNGAHTYSRGERLTFSDIWVQKHSADCRVHSYKYQGHTRAAFMSDCASWQSNGHVILLFHVGFKNTSKQVVTLVLRHLVLESRDGRSLGPVNVRSQAKYPPSFLPETTKLPPGARWSGWVTFDGRVRGFVPSSISYIDQKQTLRQVFEGRHTVA